MRAKLIFVLVAFLLTPTDPIGAAEDPATAQGGEEPAEPTEEPAEPDPESAEPVEQPAAPGKSADEEAQEASAPASEPEPKARKLVSILVLDTLDQGAGAESTAAAQAALKQALNGLDHIEVLGPRGVMRLQGAMPTEIQVQLARADNFVRKGKEDLFNLAVDEAVEAFQSARVTFRRHLTWLDDPERMIAALMGLAEALAAAGDRDSAGMAYREVLVLSPDYEPDPGQVPTKLRSLFEQVRSEVSQDQAGQLSAEVDPPGSAVVLDGLTVGKTPLVKGDIPPGLHMIRVENDGFTSLRQVVVISAGETARVEGTLETQRIPTLMRALRASLGRAKSKAQSITRGRELALASGLSFVVASQVIRTGDDSQPVLSVALLPAEGKPSVVAARLPDESSGQLDQVVGALAWQISDALEEGSAPVPVPTSLGLSFEGHLLGRPRTKVVSVVHIAPGTDTRPDDTPYPGPGAGAGVGGGAIPGGEGGESPPPASAWYTEWWFWTGVGVVVAGSVATSLALTLEPKKKIITEADQIRIRVIRNPDP